MLDLVGLLSGIGADGNGFSAELQLAAERGRP
jgi:hypothetical protein